MNEILYLHQKYACGQNFKKIILVEVGQNSITRFYSNRKTENLVVIIKTKNFS